MRFPVIVWLAALLHISWGITFMCTGVIYDTTAVHSLIPFLSIPGVSSLLIAIGIAAIIGTRLPNFYKWTIVLVTPQQMLLLLSAAGALKATAVGQFPDGTIRPIGFIAQDQLIYVLIAVFHLALMFIRLDDDL